MDSLSYINTVFFLYLNKSFSNFLSLLSKRDRLDSLSLPLRTSVRELYEAPPYTVTSISSLYRHQHKLKGAPLHATIWTHNNTSSRSIMCGLRIAWQYGNSISILWVVSGTLAVENCSVVEELKKR